jgi:hypothetical protein
MDPDLTRLLSIPGDDDLSTIQVEYVLQVGRNTAQRLIKRGKIESKRHEGRGAGQRAAVRVPRAAVVRYLLKCCTGDKATMLAAIAAQCPQYLPAAQGLQSGPLPDNVVPMNEAARTKRRASTKPAQDHPGQLLLFPVAS